VPGTCFSSRRNFGGMLQFLFKEKRSKAHKKK
jgi:hypothetical protein